MSESKLGGQFTFPGTSMTVRRIGYGAMQLAGPACGDRPRTRTLPSRSSARPSRLA